MKVRCKWAENGSLIDIEYHDNEWAVPVHNDNKLFEFLLLESAQAGLSWAIILKKREGYRKAFDNFDVQKIANYDKGKLQQLLTNPSIIRNRLKIQSAVKNARAFIRVQKEFGFSQFPYWIKTKETKVLEDRKCLLFENISLSLSTKVDSICLQIILKEDTGTITILLIAIQELPMTFSQKVVVVTGSSSGMGFETSLMLARNGFHTYATMRKLEGGGGS
jgi:DNA-3-methyladenine glycosylase I